MVSNKLHINITFSHVYVDQDDNFLLEDLPLFFIIKLQFDIRAKSKLRACVRNSYSIPPVIPHDPTLYIIYGIKITYLVGENIRKKTSHK